MGFKKALGLAVSLLITVCACAQDTLFSRSHSIDKYISNITTDGSDLYLRIGDSIFNYLDGDLNYTTQGALRFSWIEQDSYQGKHYWNHDRIIQGKNSIAEQEIAHILPGPFNGFITKAEIGNKLYLCYNGSLLEYEINTLSKLRYKGSSVRHIYSDDGIRIISTYSGVFGGKLEAHLEFDGKKIGGYSNGEFVKVKSKYFLCRDNNLYQYNKEQNQLELYQIFPIKHEVRQLIEFADSVFVVFTDGLALLDLINKSVSEHLIEDQISRAMSTGSELILVSVTGSVYRVSDKLKIRKIETKYSFEDVQSFNGDILIGGKSGLFRLMDDEIQLITNATEFYELHEFYGHLIFSNYQGLYARVNSSHIPIISNVEFNRYGLAYDKELFYAGSINGLYTISVSKLRTWLDNLDRMQEFKEKNEFNWNYALIFVTVLTMSITAVFLFTKSRNNKKVNSRRFRSNDISIDSLIQIIRDHKILSVEDLANHLDISKVQLNRKLSKYNTTALKVLKYGKKEIAKEMYTNGLPLEKISKRTGYSIRFVKENFLKDSEL
jgi:hypothetical protein